MKKHCFLNYLSYTVRSTSLGMESPTVAWALLYYLLIKKNHANMSIGQPSEGSSSAGVSSSQVTRMTCDK